MILPRRAHRWWLGWFALWPLVTAAVDYQPVIAEVRGELVRQMRGEKIAGAAIALIDGQEIVWSQGIGYADESTDRLFSTQTPFVAGDYTKLLTAIAILQLVEQGKLDLDASIDRLLPQLQIRSRFGSRRPTVRELLTHHGGLPNNLHAGSYQRESPDALFRPTEVYLAQPPGRIYAYSHLGYTLLGMIIERLSGQSYAAYVDEQVLQPLGMTGAGFDTRRRVALPHDHRRRVDEPAYSRDQAALGLFADIRDIARLAQLFMRENPEPVLSADSVAAMVSVQNEDQPLDLDNEAGLAWQLTNTGKHNVDRVLRLNTATVQYRGVMLLAPPQQVGVVIIANAASAEDPVQEVARLALDAMLEARHGIPRPENVRALPAAVPLPDGAIERPLARTYNTALGQIRFTATDGRYDMDFVGRGFSARKREDGWYQLAYRLFGLMDLRFSILEEILVRPVSIDGEEVLLAWFRGGRFLFGSAYDIPATPVESRWAAEYRLSNPGVLSERLELEEIEVVADESGLYVRYELPISVTLTPRVPLLPLGGGRYYSPGLGTNMGDEVQFQLVDGRRELHYSGWVYVAAD